MFISMQERECVLCVESSVVFFFLSESWAKASMGVDLNYIYPHINGIRLYNILVPLRSHACTYKYVRGELWFLRHSARW